MKFCSLSIPIINGASFFAPITLFGLFLNITTNAKLPLRFFTVV